MKENNRMTLQFDRRIFSIGSLAAVLGLASSGTVVAAHQSQGVIDRVDPDQAAVDQSRLEVDGRIADLYFQMHSDARAQVPLYAMVYWYETTFLPTGPNVIEVNDFQIGEWTWEVTGETYGAYEEDGGAPITAEVAYTQSFADGSSKDATLHLVQEQTNDWRWFFGESRDFLDEQIALADENGVASISAMPDWAAGALAVGMDGYANLPEEYPGTEDAVLEVVPSGGVGGQESRRYSVDGETALATVAVTNINLEEVTALEAIQFFVAANGNQKTIEVLSWSLTPATDVVFATVRFSKKDEPDVIATYVGGASGDWIVKITGPDEDVVTALGETMGS